MILKVIIKAIEAFLLFSIFYWNHEGAKNIFFFLVTFMCICNILFILLSGKENTFKTFNEYTKTRMIIWYVCISIYTLSCAYLGWVFTAAIYSVTSIFIVAFALKERGELGMDNEESDAKATA